ncbi:MAG: bifunctional aldolase/short-chain dehydrogenase [Roseitalea sp.]|jgi:rhamnose utilization protein RhaD (predicted bifunctional aldolase and dehydrogenase)/NAD(P)-dependent dehydrogenase (short-subunit alcohol dehydrogenase family)|nr:bifunctional aldolase/short-chain dehydrogenase [Roseitalea sp.]MBO6720226.1 bifunctional aldolase/short-chain dehydrogenase [Roseitalea sp.]MBO6742586.1 bifunctional aldolase/short-chain dehydrogenase [Roseitalea sp.]
MRDNRWNEDDAERFAAAEGETAADRALGHRVYTSRLIGSDPDLVMHGGGNTSVKATRPTLQGEDKRVLHIKGSGWDLDTIEGPGLPGVWLDPLLALRTLDALSDEQMVDAQRAALLQSSSPNPSVETLLHAFLPHTFVDHTHATAFLALANLPQATEVIAGIFGGRLAVVPYIMPGFALAKKAAEVFEADPDVEGLILLNHGHFTFGETAKESYDRVIDHTNRVEQWLADKAGGRTFETTVHRVRVPEDAVLAADVLPVLRGMLGAMRSDHHGTDMPMPVFDVRGGPAIETFLKRDDLDDLSRRGVGSPDHVIRTKAFPLHLSRATIDGGTEATRAAVDAWADAYRAYFASNNERVGGIKTMLERIPGLAWIEGVGLIGIGKDSASAAAAADIGEQTIEVMALGEAAGSFRPIGEADTFDMEHWSLEQAKLAKSRPKAFAGRVVLVTGGGGAIGLATAKAFAALGASVAVADLSTDALDKAQTALGGSALTIEADITAPGAGAAAVEAVCARFGGIDIVVSNAGAAMQGLLVDLDDDTLRTSFELNFFSHLALAKAAVATIRAQGRGGQLLFNVSKQAVNPGKGFGAYGLPKAATFFLVRQLALELGGEGIRVNGVNADRIRSGLLTDAFIEKRAEARGVSTADYMAGNLLQAEVEASHVADAFVALAQAERTTAHVMTVDGGNIEAALR